LESNELLLAEWINEMDVHEEKLLVEYCPDILRKLKEI
jgi:hypothetical protein